MKPRLHLPRPKIRPFWRSVHLTHRLYKITGGYTYMRKGARQLLFALALLIGVLWAVNNYVIDIQALTERFTNEVHWSLVYLTLFVSEIVVGILPADLFIIWSQSQPMPWLSIAALSGISYASGNISYWVGRRLHRNPKIHRWVHVNYATLFNPLRRFGGILIVVAALTPLSFPAASTVAGMVQFPARWYRIYALSIIVRYFLFAAIIFGLV
jgi:membrane protein DedA with SNARE-associated domain